MLSITSPHLVVPSYVTDLIYTTNDFSSLVWRIRIDFPLHRVNAVYTYKNSAVSYDSKKLTKIMKFEKQ